MGLGPSTERKGAKRFVIYGFGFLKMEWVTDEKKEKQAVTKTVFKFYFYDPIMLNAFSIWRAVMTLRIPPFATVFF